MEKIEFEKVKKEIVLDTICFEEEWMSGDADAYEYVEVGLPFKYSEWELPENTKIIQDKIKQYVILSNLTDINHKDYAEGRGGKKVDVEALYGEEISNMYYEAPGDSTCDNQFRANLSSLTLKAIDKEGAEWQFNINL